MYIYYLFIMIKKQFVWIHNKKFTNQKNKGIPKCFQLIFLVDYGWLGILLFDLIEGEIEGEFKGQTYVMINIRSGFTVFLMTGIEPGLIMVNSKSNKCANHYTIHTIHSIKDLLINSWRASGNTNEERC